MVLMSWSTLSVLLFKPTLNHAGKIQEWGHFVLTLEIGGVWALIAIEKLPFHMVDTL